MLPVPLLILAAIGAFIGLIIYGNHLWEKRRSESLAAMAEQLGFEFTGDRKTRWLSAPLLPLFNLGYRAKAWNIMVAESDRETVLIFDYRYTVGSGKNSRTYKQTVVGFDSEHLRLPNFVMQPESLFHKLGSMFGGQDIDFQMFPEFSRNYLLKGTPESRVRELFHPALLDHLQNISGVHLQGVGHSMIYFRSGRRTDPSELRDLLQAAYEVYALVQQSSAKDAQAAIADGENDS